MVCVCVCKLKKILPFSCVLRNSQKYHESISGNYMIMVIYYRSSWGHGNKCVLHFQPVLTVSGDSATVEFVDYLSHSTKGVWIGVEK